MLTKLMTTAGVALALALPAAAQDVDLPDTVTLTTYDVGGTAYNQAIAVGKALQDELGVALRVVGTGNDQAQLAPVRQGRMPFSLAGSHVFYAFEGVGPYASPEWGPQRLRAMNLAGAENCLTYAVAGDSGIETMADFKGKRIAWPVASPALQSNAIAMLAFAGLTLDDVTIVEVPSYAGGMDAIINDQVDGMTTVSTGGLVEKAFAGSRGLSYVPYPHDDAEGWARMQAKSPHFGKRKAYLVGGTPRLEEPLDCIGVPYPNLVTYSADADDELVYNFTKALDMLVPVYSKAEPGTAGYAANSQMFGWTVPYHEAAIKYYKEAGVWNDDLQAHTDELYKRQAVLAEAWKEMEGKSGDSFEADWLAIRAAALTDAGLDPYFE